MKFMILTTLLLSLFSGPIMAMGQGKGKRGEKREVAQKMKAELNLSDEQLQKIKEIRKRNKSLHKEMRERMKAARKDLRESLGNPKLSKADLLVKFNQLETLKSEMSRKRFETMLSIREQLDGTQITKFHQLNKDRKVSKD